MSDRDTHTSGLELLYLEMDGELNAGDRARLQRYLQSDPAAARERRELARMADLLAGARVPAREGFTAQVLDRLPAAGWETRSPRGWWVAAAVFALLATAAALLAGSGTTSGPLATTAQALTGLLAASVVAGAGLMSASWEGIGVALSGVLEGSPLNWVAFAVLVVGVNVLLVRRLRRRRAAQAVETGASRQRK